MIEIIMGAELQVVFVYGIQKSFPLCADMLYPG